MDWKGPGERQGRSQGLSPSLTQGRMLACTVTGLRGRELLQSKGNLKREGWQGVVHCLGGKIGIEDDSQVS